MTQTVSIRCDRCSLDSPATADRAKSVYLELRDGSTLSQLDLCPLCANAVKRELRPRPTDA